MPRITEQLTEQFYRWELRGRGWSVFDAPVALEPPFRPFTGHFVERPEIQDDGRRHTRRSGFMEHLRRSVSPPQRREEPPKGDEPEPNWKREEDETEIQLTLPISRAVPKPSVETFIRHVCRPDEQLALEILGTAQEIVPQFVASPRTATRVERALRANYPGVTPIQGMNGLGEAWSDTASAFAVVEVGLGIEFMVPLGNPNCELLAGVVSALDSLSDEELGLFQILFEPVRNSWIESIVSSVSDPDGQPFFTNRPELLRAAQQKISSPLFAVVIRFAAAGTSSTRAWDIISDMAAGFSALSRPGSNYLVPLSNEGYPTGAHEEDILYRQSRRSGMLLNLDELSDFLTLPASAVSRRLRRETVKTRPAPLEAIRDGSLLLGVNRHGGISKEVRLSPEERVRHCHIIGASGTGKSTLLFNLIKQDIDNGQGIAVLDPHGDLVERVLGIIPEERIDDVVLIDPSDEEYSVGFNILAAHSDFEKGLLASDLVSVFERLSTSWGDQMNSVFRNAVLAFLESSEGGTLSELRRFLLDPVYRRTFLSTVTDPEIVYYWQKAFPQLSGNRSVGPVVTRLDEFLSRKPIRYMVSQKENRVNFAEVIDGGKILLAKLSQGLIGRENSYLLGSLILSKIQQMATSRQRIEESRRRVFWCYVDEFPSFITPSMAEILTGARKYKVGLTLAHQELRRLRADDEVASAVLANAYTRIVFRVGDADARSLESGLGDFEAVDLQNLETGQAICRLGRSDNSFNLMVAMPTPPTGEEYGRIEQVAAVSRLKYAQARTEIDAELRQHFRSTDTTENEPSSRPVSVTPPIPAAGQERPIAETNSERKSSSVTPPETREPGDLGRGGEQHKAIQGKIKAAAEKLGFRVNVEERVLDGAGSIDLVLVRDETTIACEINVTSTIDYEVGNIRKCLKANFSRIAVISPRADRLSRLEEAIRAAVPSEEHSKFSFHPPDEFIAALEAGLVTQRHPAAPTETRRRGYKVKRSVVKVSAEEAKAREQAAIKAMAEKLRRESP